LKQGLAYGLFMYIFMTFLMNPLFTEDPISLKNLL